MTDECERCLAFYLIGGFAARLRGHSFYCLLLTFESLLGWLEELKDLRNVSLIPIFRRHKSIAPPLTVAGAGEVQSKEDLPASSLQRRKDYLDLTFEVSFFFAAYLSHARRWQYTQIRQVLALCNITSGNFTNFTKINSFFWICFGASVGKVLQALPNPLIFYFSLYYYQPIHL